jgi:hypothetical protein
VRWYGLYRWLGKTNAGAAAIVTNVNALSIITACGFGLGI